MRNWLVIKTRPRWEKKVAKLLTDKGVEVCCPLVKQQRQWSDRVKTLDLPLLPSLLFVRIAGEQRTEVRLTEGVVNFVYNNGKPVVLKEKLLQQIQQFQQEHHQVAAVKAENPGKGVTVLLPQGTYKRDTLWLETLNILLVAPVLHATIAEASTDKN